MLAKLKALLTSDFADDSPGEDTLHLACAALMVEVATIDRHFDESEFKTLINELQTQFELTDADAKALVELAKENRDDAVSLHQFTREINQYLPQQDKFKLLQSMWAVAYADGHIDKYEEHIIRRAAELIHVSHSDFIKAKLSAKNIASHH